MNKWDIGLIIAGVLAVVHATIGWVAIGGYTERCRQFYAEEIERQIDET